MVGKKIKMNLLIQHVPMRILTGFLIIAMGVSVTNPESVLFLVIIGQVWLMIGQVSAKFFWWRLRLILLFILFSFIFFPLYESGSLYDLGLFSVSITGLEKAWMYSGRLIFSIQTLTLLFYRISVPVFFQSLLHLKVPGIFVELLLFTLRFIDVLKLEVQRMQKSLTSRGFKQSNWFSVNSYLTLSKAIGSLLFRSFRRSERIYSGMLARGYRGIVIKSEPHPFPPQDLFRIGLWMIPVLSLLIMDKFQEAAWIPFFYLTK